MYPPVVITGVPHLVYENGCRYLAINGVRVDESIWALATDNQQPHYAVAEIEITVKRKQDRELWN